MTIGAFSTEAAARRRPEGLLMLMSLAMPLAFSVWMAMLNNFSHDIAGFDGRDIGAVQAVREIPGLLSVLVVYLLLLFREQTLALLSLMALGLGTALTGFFPSFWGLMITTIIGSVGFHYYETVNQSLQLQWLSKERAPIVIGRLAGVGSATAFVAFGSIWLFSLDSVSGGTPPYVALYLLGGLTTVVLAVTAWLMYPHFPARTEQRRGMVLRSRYWLYYALVFLGGARRQIFVVFAGFMMVQKFGFSLSEFALLLIVNHAINMVAAPLMGRTIARFGERVVLSAEYIGLALIFAAYAVVESASVAAALYVIDHLFFGLRFAQRTYFQKIADPRDFAPTSAVAFTINHIAAVALPVPLGLLYVISPGAVFWVGVALALMSLVLARLVPRWPAPGCETMLTRPRPAPHPAE